MDTTDTPQSEYSFSIADTPLKFHNFDLVQLPLSQNLKIFSSKPLFPTRIVDIAFTERCHGPSIFRKKGQEREITISKSSSGNGYLLSCPTGQFLAHDDFQKIDLWAPFEKEIADTYDGYPLLQIIIWGRVCLTGGCYLHGALLVIDEQYLLFLGQSGIGKTTLSNLAVQQGQTCLTEESPFLTKTDNTLWVHSSPWYGAKGPEKPLSGILSGIFFLRQSHDNTILKLSKTDAGKMLLKNTRTFNWLPQTIPASIELLNTTIESVPTYDFGFRPDSSAITAIRSTL